MDDITDIDYMYEPDPPHAEPKLHVWEEPGGWAWWVSYRNRYAEGAEIDESSANYMSERVLQIFEYPED